MSIGVIIAFLKANPAIISTILLIISEALGADPRVKANGLLSFILLQVNKKLKENGAKEI